MKQYIYIAAAIAALWGSVALVGQIKGCKHEETNQTAILHPATTQQVVTHTVTHTVQKPGGAVETTTTQDTGTINVSEPAIPDAKEGSIRRHGYISITGGYGSQGSLITENYGAGAGWYLTNNIAVGARYDKIGSEQRIGVEVTLTF